MAAVGVWIGAYLTWWLPVYYAPLMASLAAFCICAAGNIINDLLDVEIDRVNRPDRVLVRGGLSIGYAKGLAAGLNVVALLLAVVVSVPVMLMALAVIGLLAAYNVWLKKMPLVGNAAVALLAGLTFLTGGVAVDATMAFRLPGPLIPAIFAFFFHLVREIIKDVQDTDGDQRAGIRSLPLVAGVTASLTAALILFFVMALLTFVPIAYGWFGPAYKIITVYIVDLPVLCLLIIVWGYPSRAMLKAASLALKVGMMLGLLALMLG